MRQFITLISMATLTLFMSCDSKTEVAEKQPYPAGHPMIEQERPQHEVLVKEVIQTEAYTYLNVEENNKTFWVAVAKQETKVGDVILFSRSMEMRNFESKTLNRIFPSILFVDGAQNKNNPTKVVHNKAAVSPSTDSAIEAYKDGITIETLFSNPKKYAGKTVSIRGKVTKVNNQIMGRNWVHLQDGTESNGKFDLMVTTNETIALESVIIVQGVIALDRILPDNPVL